MAEPEDDGAPGVPEWVVTYGDMMSLLLTFFIMLVSLSEIKQDDGQVRAMLDAIRQAFGPTESQGGAPGTSLQTTSILNKTASKGGRSEGGVQRASRNAPGTSGPFKPVARLGHGTVVTMGGPAKFQRFSVALSPDLKKDLDIIADVVAPKPNRLMVRGHASLEPLPDHSPFRDKSELSFVRARAVAEYLISKGIDRRRLIVSAAGDTEPRVRTGRKTDRSLNRRVDVFLIDSYITPR